MNKIQKQKGWLTGLSIIAFIFGIIGVIGGIALIIIGIKDIASSNAVSGVLKLIGALLLLIACGSATIWGFTSFFVSRALKATNGSLADENLCIGTANMLKCPKCGTQVQEGDKNCGNCGAELSTTKICTNCGHENSSKSKKCTNCGADLK